MTSFEKLRNYREKFWWEPSKKFPRRSCVKPRCCRRCVAAPRRRRAKIWDLFLSTRKSEVAGTARTRSHPHRRPSFATRHQNEVPQLGLADVLRRRPPHGGELRGVGGLFVVSAQPAREHRRVVRLVPLRQASARAGATTRSFTPRSVARSSKARKTGSHSRRKTRPRNASEELAPIGAEGTCESMRSGAPLCLSRKRNTPPRYGWVM